ncbi:hypothetical protein P7H16_19410 [Paenibacillus larvae]|nr:hypothetical protein [Paenibacillus larvae]MDT2248653.1 hypothetical protein [Paenibacillus larvae]
MHFDHPSEHERPQGGSPFGFDYPPRPPYSNYPYAAPPRLPAKKKWLACLFSIMMPGTGQMYLGQMNRDSLLFYVLSHPRYLCNRAQRCKTWQPGLNYVIFFDCADHLLL